jgi:ribosomal peptide maturation radical SAM protein 1
MAFRAKSPERLLRELHELASRHRSFRFTAVDNILDPSYLDSFFSLASQMDFSGEFFYEVKSNLLREQIKVLYEGGVRRIQPGIESLNSHVLSLMRKGVRAIQNINTLRWTLYYNMDVSWNILWGFPGETDDDYRQQLDIMRHLVHLQPPESAGRIWMERYSPIYVDRDTFPTRYVRPQASYAYVYPSQVDLSRIAYFFDYQFRDALPDSTYKETLDWVHTWQRAWRARIRPTLTFRSAPGFVLIEDFRDSDNPGVHTFSGPLAAMYVLCSDRPQSARSLQDVSAFEWPTEEMEAAVDEFCARGLMVRDGNSFLSLALPAIRGH